MIFHKFDLLIDFILCAYSTRKKKNVNQFGPRNRIEKYMLLDNKGACGISRHAQFLKYIYSLKN